MDLDRWLKQVNDTYGHLVGDAVLREAARRMKGAVRRYDAVGRYGGEEFLIVLPGCHGSDAREQAERIREAIASQPFAVNGNPLVVTCSIGVSCRRAPTLLDSDDLVRDADQALYQAKDAGRDRVYMYGWGPGPGGKRSETGPRVFIACSALALIAFMIKS